MHFHLFNFAHIGYCSSNTYYIISPLNTNIIYYFIKNSYQYSSWEYRADTHWPLISHNKIHTGENLFSHWLLISHTKIHTGENLFSHVICDILSDCYFFSNEDLMIYTHMCTCIILVYYDDYNIVYILEIPLSIIKMFDLLILRCGYGYSEATTKLFSEQIRYHIGKSLSSCNICYIAFNNHIYFDEYNTVFGHKSMYMYLPCRDNYINIALSLEIKLTRIIVIGFQKLNIEPCGTKGKSFLHKLRWR